VATEQLSSSGGATEREEEGGQLEAEREEEGRRHPDMADGEVLQGRRSWQRHPFQQSGSGGHLLEFASCLAASMCDRVI
jgi:hypothetical protein